MARETGGGKRDKSRWLSDYYETARNSVGLPVEEDTAAMAMFRLVLMEYLDCCKLRSQIEELAGVAPIKPDGMRLVIGCG